MTSTAASARASLSELRATPLGCSVDLLAVAGDHRVRRPTIVTAGGWRLLVGEPHETLTDLPALDRYGDAIGWCGQAPDGPPFRGGAVGFLSDDLSAGFLQLPPDRRPLGHLPPLHFTTHTWAIAAAPDGEGWIVGDASDTRRLTAIVHEIGPGTPAATPQPQTATPTWSRPQHARAVAQILDWIAAGDLYQANLTFQIATPWTADPLTLARRLEEATPGSAHAALIPLGPGSAIVSVSPETFLRTSGDVVVTRPIKGTRPRSRDEGTDRRLASELQASSKDAAEHVMIVDLARNDLGRVCRPGSVRVPELAELEGHPTVWHLTSTVTGTIEPHVRLSQLLTAMFPPGSVTGAPKRMAVERIRRLEPQRRGVYCGAIGLLAPGVVDLSVAIRTAVVHEGIASYGAGGGIVADSSADEEYDEALAKAAAFLTATNGSLGPLGAG